MEIRRSATEVHEVFYPEDQKTIFTVRIPTLENVTVMVFGHNNPRAVVWALSALGSDENLLQTWKDLGLPDPVPDPVNADASRLG